MWQIRNRRSTWKGLVAGAIGGAVASFAMNQFQAGMTRLVDKPEQPGPPPRKAQEAQGWREQRAGARENPTDEERANVKAAAAVSEAVFHHELEPSEKEWAGQLVHYAYGTVAGALYGAAAEHWDDVRAGQGAAFGTVLWGLSDEVGVPAMGLSKGPQAYPLRTHAMALAAHLAYSAVTEWTRRLLRSGVLAK